MLPVRIYAIAGAIISKLGEDKEMWQEREYGVLFNIWDAHGSHAGIFPVKGHVLVGSGLGVNNSLYDNSGFVITHLLSGYQLGIYFDDLGTAKKAVEEIAKLADWNLPNDEVKADFEKRGGEGKVIDACKKIVQTIRDEVKA